MINVTKFARDWRRDPPRAAQDFQECLRLYQEGETGGIDPIEFSLHDLAGEFIFEDGQPIGLAGVNRLYDPRQQGISLTEAEGAVTSSTFANITGQLLISKLMAAYQAEEFVVSKLVSTVPTRLSGEKIPGISGVTDPERDSLKVPEGQEYPHAGFTEDYVETPATDKYGLIIPVTKETIFFDRTNQVMERASSVGEILGLNKEKRLMDALISTANTKLYKWKGTEYQTYYSAADSGANWINHLDNNALADWTDIDNAEQLFMKMTDPNTGEPIVMSGKRQMLVTPARFTVASRILTATETRSGTGNIVVGGNPAVARGITLYESRLLYARLIATDAYGHNQSAANAAGFWFYGDFAKTFAYMENWPIQVVKSPQNSEAEFNQDIVVRFKASERGAAAVMDPRYIVRCNSNSGSSSSSGA